MWFDSSVVECRNGIPEALGSSPGCARYFFHHLLHFKRASGIPFLHSTTELLNHMSICLTIYHQIPVHGYKTDSYCNETRGP